MERASSRNQARIHAGFHYPRDFVTAKRSQVNSSRFAKNYPSAVAPEIRSIYAIAKQRSLTTPKVFSDRMTRIGAQFELAPPDVRAIFNPHSIEAIFEVEEKVFDASQLKRLVFDRLMAENIHLQLNSTIFEVSEKQQTAIQVASHNADSGTSYSTASYVFNCTYSGLNLNGPTGPVIRTRVKHEIAELALIRIPKELEGLGITVMDGPFFSLLPYPQAECYSLSHVRYTPHESWEESGDTNPYLRLSSRSSASRADRMLRDAERFIPQIGTATYLESIFEVKTVLVDEEESDGRPILVEESSSIPGLYSILGAKIDNIFDVTDHLGKIAMPLIQS